MKLRWSDPQPDDPSTPLDWRFPALIMSTLFLNIRFMIAYGPDLLTSGPLLLHVDLLATAALLIAALFFLVPALATQAAGRPLLGAMENSVGSIPAFVLRLCCALFLVLWIAELVAIPALWMLPFSWQWPASRATSGLIAAGLLVFLFITGLQSLRTSAKLALFTNKLCIALLLAALLRVHDGWPAILKGLPALSVRSPVLDLWHLLSLLGF